MIIHYLSSTYSSHGVLTSRLQICASILLADVRQPTQLHDQKQYRSQDYPTMIDGAAFPARSNIAAPCKVHSIPIPPPH
jgi:hypothetical protein